MAHRSVTGKAQVTVRITDQFRKDLNLLMASYKTDASEAVRNAVALQAEYVRVCMARKAALVVQPVVQDDSEV